MIDLICIASWNVDLIAHVKSPLLRGQTQMAHNFEKQPGGKGSNCAIAAARFGANVGLIARIGGDDFGQMGTDLWSKEGIDYSYVIAVPNEPNGTALILVYQDGDNSVAVYPGAGAGLSVHNVLSAEKMFEECKLVVASCEVPIEATLEAFKLARKYGKKTILNPAPAIELPEEIYPLVDVLIPNESELVQLGGLQITNHESTEHQNTIAQKLLKRGVGSLILTQGENGCSLFQTGFPVIQIKGHPVQVADTIGAGDTFTGVLAACLSNGENLQSAMKLANCAAALSVQSHGAVSAMPTRQITTKYLLKN